MKAIRSLLVVTLSLAVSGLALAGQGSPRVDHEQFRQQQRIEQGVARGSLTRHETLQLQRGQHRVARMEARAKADGVVTRHERAMLHQAQARESARIQRQKHDRQHARWQDKRWQHERYARYGM
ncbi:MAG TPA: hypothetical protein PLN02_04985 [Azonexus sp.]|nr:hypothetical protein [Azonexus sp.]